MRVCECSRSFSNVWEIRSDIKAVRKRSTKVHLFPLFLNPRLSSSAFTGAFSSSVSGKRYLYRSEIPNQCHLLPLPSTIRQVPQVHRVVQLVRLRFLDLLCTNWVFLSLLDVFQVRTFPEITCDLLPIYFPGLI